MATPETPFDLFEVTRFQFTPGNDKPRSATDKERSAYLRWLAGRRGVEIPSGATFDNAGIFDPAAKAYVLEMPGYGVTTMVTMETTDEAGNVIRRVTMATDNKGAIPLKAKRVHDETGIAPMRAKKPVPRDTAELRAEIGRPPLARQEPPAAEPIDWQAVVAWDAPYQPPEPSEIVAAVAVHELPPVPADDIAALHALVANLSSRIVALEQGQATQPSRSTEIEDTPRPARSPAHIRAIRAYLAMRAQRSEEREARSGWHDRFQEMASRGASLEEARDALATQCERLENDLARALLDAKRSRSVEEAHLAARARGDRLLSRAVRQRAAIELHKDDGRGYRAEIGALRRQLAVATAPRVIPAPQPGTMAVAFQSLHSRVAAQAEG